MTHCRETLKVKLNKRNYSFSRVCEKLPTRAAEIETEKRGQQVASINSQSLMLAAQECVSQHLVSEAAYVQPTRGIFGGKCYNCNKLGHRSFECGAMMKTCTRCQQTWKSKTDSGFHVAKDCNK